MAHDDAARAAGKVDGVLVVRSQTELEGALRAVHVANAVIVAPEVGGGTGALGLLRMLQRRWPGVLTYWMGRYARPTQPGGFVGSRHVKLEGPFEGAIDRLGELVSAAALDGARRRDRERELGLALAHDLGFDDSTLASVICVLLAHRLCDAQLHEALGQERSRFNRYLSDVIYPAVGGPPLVDIVHHLRALEQDHASRREKRRGRSGQHSRSA